MSTYDPEAPETVVSISQEARDMFLQAREDDPEPEKLALRLEVTGSNGLEYTYDMHFQLREAVGATDAVLRQEELDLVVPKEDLPAIRGAVIDYVREDGREGWVIDNPNKPKPQIGTPLPLMTAPPAEQSSPAVGAEAPEELEGDLSGDVAQRVLMVLERQVNPAIAAHGGYAELVSVEDDVAYLRLSGGCQGCGMATVTLGQGIEVAIKELVPEIRRVVDVTDHASGTNPFYEPAKK